MLDGSLHPDVPSVVWQSGDYEEFLLHESGYGDDSSHLLDLLVDFNGLPILFCLTVQRSNA
jgi:hypothetical protein